MTLNIIMFLLALFGLYTTSVEANQEPRDDLSKKLYKRLFLVWMIVLILSCELITLKI